MAGEDAILVHRLLKNTIAANEYILLTEPFHQMLGGMTGGTAQIHDETYDDLGAVRSMVYFPAVTYSRVSTPVAASASGFTTHPPPSAL